uniref:Uncharacterized protein n=1 Tax=Cacopsylla melanoneura TaxID=428564 RepID=A0A8D8SXK7_9HEMI
MFVLFRKKTNNVTFSLFGMKKTHVHGCRALKTKYIYLFKQIKRITYKMTDTYRNKLFLCENLFSLTDKSAVNFKLGDFLDFKTKRSAEKTLFSLEKAISRLFFPPMQK